MLGVIIGIFFILHGLVHVLYFGQSQRFFELRPEMVWPDGSQAFSKLIGNGGTRLLASFSLLLAAVGFVVVGAGLLFGQTWWRPIFVGSTAISTATFLLFWDGNLQGWEAQGGIGILINVATLIALLLLQWSPQDL